MSRIAQDNNIKPRLVVHKLRKDLIENVRNVLLGSSVALDGIDLRVVVAAEVDGALHGDGLAAAAVEGALTLGPPPQRAHVGEDDAGGLGVVLAAGLLIDGLDDRGHAAFVDAAHAANHAMGEDTELLLTLAEDDNDAGLRLDVLAHKDGDMRVRSLGAKRQDDLLQTLGLKALVNKTLDSLIEVEALTLIEAIIAVEEELEVELWVGDETNFIFVVDIVATMKEGQQGETFVAEYRGW